MLKRLISLALSAAVLFASPGSCWVWAAEAAGATLNGVEVGPDEVTLHLSAQVKYNTFFTSDPPRLVVELLNTEYVPETKTLEGKGQFLKKVRSGQYQKEPTMISRIVLDLFKLVGYQARWDNHSLIIHLQGVGASTEKAAAPKEPAKPVKEAAKTAAAAAGAAAAVAAAGTAKAAEAKAQEPAAAAKAAETGAKAASAPVKAAEKPAAQAAAKPVEKPAAPAAAKPVEKPAAPAAAKPVEKPAAAAKAPEKPLPLPAVEKEFSKEVSEMADDEPEALKDSGIKSPAKPAEKTAKTPSKPAVPSGFSSELAEMAADPSEGESEQAKSAGTFSGYSRTRRDILASLSTELKSVDYENVDVRDVIKHLASEAKINIIYGSDVSGPVTLHLTDVPFSEIFMTVMRIHGLVADQVGENILRIVTPATLKNESSVAITQTRVIKLKYTMASEIKTAVEAVYKAEKRGGSIIDDKVTNSLIVTDTLDGIASIERLLAKLDVRPQQVMIEAKLIEVKLTNEVHFGIQWDYFGVDQSKIGGQLGTNVIGAAPYPDSTFSKPFDDGTIKFSGVSGSGVPGASARGTGVSLPAKQVVGAFTFGRVTNNYWLSATLTAAASQGKVKVLSDPKIATLNGKKASINITTAIPYQTSNVASTGVTSQQVGTTTTGIKLDVTPTLNADGRITLEVNPNVSQPSANVTSAVPGVPAVDTREAKTTVLVHDGETIVIGGLITDSVANGVTKVPFFGDIPLLGWFFKKKSVERTRVELLIFVTTRVLPS